ncbi:MAG: molybdopterin-binding protein, partial [Marivita sp.]|uniref:molybdopterin-binding protein n=1 Tax=Marivita sp. TaxID=2003365 RepID=UPI003EF6F990
MTVSRSLTPPPLRDDCFALPRGTEWTPVDTALAQLRDRLSVVVGAQSVATADAAGRVLADDVRAVRSNPPAANSAVDGYGVTWAETGSGAQQMPLVDGRAAAGDPFDQSVPAGHAVRILTGAILPDGVDTVILQEDVTTDGAHIAFRGPLRGGANARKAGEDCAKGEVILQAGRVLTPADLALATATGVATLPVRDRLSVAVLSTGDELCEAGSDAGPSRTYDANRPMLLELARRWGCDCVDLGIVADNRDALRAA